MLTWPKIDAADHAGEGKDRQDHPGGSADCIAIKRWAVDKQPRERHQRADNREQSCEHTRRSARPESKAMRTRKIAREVQIATIAKCDQCQPAIKIARTAHFETKPTPVRRRFSPPRTSLLLPTLILIVV